MTEIATPAPFNVAEMPLAECAALGGVLTASHQGARNILDQYWNCDITDPRLKQIDTLARAIVAKGATPSPLEIVAEANATGVIQPRHRTALGRLLMDLTDVRIIPQSHVPSTYARVLTHDAVRRRIGQAATRLNQAAQDAGLNELVEITQSEIEALTTALDRLSDGGK